MSGFVDLHIHSTASYGTVSPADIVFSACEKGLKGICITDRYTTDGGKQAAYAAGKLPLSVVPGVEIDSFYGDQDIRILGYGIDPDNDMLTQVLSGLRSMSYEACSSICAELGKYDISISMSALFRMFGCHMITREHIARFLAKAGAVSSPSEAFEKYIGRGACAYVPEYRMSPEQTCTLIELAGGIGVLAYPGGLRYENERELFRILADLKSSGIKGIEIMHPWHSPYEESLFRTHALSLGLLMFGGSDFSGAFSPDIEIGTGKGSLLVPASMLNCIPGML